MHLTCIHSAPRRRHPPRGRSARSRSPLRRSAGGGWGCGRPQRRCSRARVSSTRSCAPLRERYRRDLPEISPRSVRGERDRAEIRRRGTWRGTRYEAQAMARMGRLPSALAAEASPERTPAAALIVSSCAIILLLSMPFTELLELDMSLYAAALGLEMLALLRLRWTEPHLHRPFEVPSPPRSLVQRCHRHVARIPGLHRRIARPCAIGADPPARARRRLSHPARPLRRGPGRESVQAVSPPRVGVRDGLRSSTQCRRAEDVCAERHGQTPALTTTM